jgi:hypothetical protein
MRAGLGRLRQAAERLGDHAGEAVRDPAVRESAQQVARKLRDALDATFSELGEEIRGRVRSRREPDPASPDPASPKPPAKEISGGPEAQPGSGTAPPAGPADPPPGVG